MTIYETVRPLYYITKITGFACFSIDGDITQGRIKTKLIDILLFLIWLALQTANGISNIIKAFDASTVAQTELVAFGKKIQFLFSTFNVSFYILASFIKRYKIWSILHHLHIFDENIKALGYSVNHKKHKLFIWFYALASVMYTVIGLILVISSGYYALIPFAYVPTVYSFFQLGILKLSILSVYARQHDFIKCFRKYFLSNKNSIRYVKSKNVSQVMIFSKLHDNLNLAVASINKSFSLISFVCLSIYLSHAVYSIYGVIQDYNKLSSISFKNIFVQLRIRYLLACFTFNVLIIFSASNEITRRGKVVSNLIYKAIYLTQNESIREELRTFVEKVERTMPAISCGFFSINWSLLYSIIAATTTYLLILIQFDKSADSRRKCVCGCKIDV